MIPSKLYIPTTTLNFNNIMASESISPAGFYYVRGFGYKRFDKVEPNNLDNRIILYEKFPVFNINDKELENYPLVIEIDTITIGEDVIKEENGVFYSEETIYLNPFSTQFIFNTETEKRSTLSKVEQSLNTKMVAIYRNCIIAKTPNIESFEWKSVDLTDSKSDFSKISKDRKINKLKGFLYAYLLGANKSVSKNVVYAKRRTKIFSNELSALVNSISAKEAEKLLNCLDIFVNDINGISDKIRIELKDLPIVQHCNIIATIPNQKEFLPKLLNEYLAENWNSEEFVSSRLDFADAGGKLFREELQDKWENSPYRKYINDLRNNLKSHTAFSLQSTDNLTLQSFAAFCQKGEEDIDKLEDYLISNGIGDFRIAFALWGIVFGFANTPKTLTNDLFLSNDSNYVSEVYKYIFKQVHKIDLIGNFERKTEEKEFVSLPSKMNEQPKTEEKKETTTQQQANEIEIEYRGKLKQVPKITNSQIDSVIEVLKNNHFLIKDKLFDSISKIDKLGKKTNIFKAIKDCLQSENQQKVVQQQESQNRLFDYEIESVGKEFYKDNNVLAHIYSILANDDEKKKVKKEIDWIQKVHREGGYKKQSGEWVELKEHSNIEVIRHLENNLKKRFDPNLLNKIVLKLKELYS